MKATLPGTARRFIAPFEEETEATAHDCLAFDDQVVFLVAASDMVTTIGPGGRTVQPVERQLGRMVELVEDADTPEAFVAGALAPAAVRHMTLSRQNGTVAYVEVAEADRGVTISASGKTINTARESTRRHYDIGDIQLT